MQNERVAPILACATLFARAFRLSYDQLRFKLDALRTPGIEPSTLRGIATQLVADTAMREQPSHDALELERAIDGTPVIVYPSEDARPGWVLARMPSGTIGFLFVVHVDMREARKYLFAQMAARHEAEPELTLELARKLDLAEVLDRGPAEIDRVLDVLLGVDAAA